MQIPSSSRLPGTLGRFCGMPATILAVNAAILLSVQAGPGVDPAHDGKTMVETQHIQAVHRPKISKLPYLTLVEPEPLRFAGPASPRFRQPPLLPTPKPAPVVSKTPTPAPDDAAANGNKAGDSGVLPSEAPPILLSKDKQPSTPVPAADHGKQDPVLTPSANPEQELKDAVIYFDTPVGPRGSRAIVPLPIPGLTPGYSAPVSPQTVVPESHANYREVEK